MISYNLYAYCENNPVNYWDPTGQSFEAALGGWVSSMWWLNGVDGPLPIGDAVFWSVTAILGIAVVGKVIYVAATDSPDVRADEKTPADTAPTPEEKNGEVNEKSSSPGKMQQEVKRGQAPKDVARVDRPKNGKPHVHFKDGTSLNNDGTIHDKRAGIPKLTRPVRNWLRQHHWSTEIKIFP